jgi:hypothetical protein
MSVYGTKQTYFVDVVMSAIDPKRNTIATCAGRAVYGWSRTELSLARAHSAMLVGELRSDDLLLFVTDAIGTSLSNDRCRELPAGESDQCRRGGVDARELAALQASLSLKNACVRASACCASAGTRALPLPRAKA